MAIVLCPRNHYYDNKKQSSCPYCKAEDEREKEEWSLNVQLTSALEITGDGEEQLTQAYGEDVCSEERTIGIYSRNQENEMTAGWLVCIKGKSKGRSFSIHCGRNFAGCGDYMDIVLDKEDGFRQEMYFSIVYDPKSISFFLVPDAGGVLLNDKAVARENDISENDIIGVGKSEYRFIPYCRKGREWE